MSQGTRGSLPPSRCGALTWNSACSGSRSSSRGPPSTAGRALACVALMGTCAFMRTRASAVTALTALALGAAHGACPSSSSSSSPRPRAEGRPRGVGDPMPVARPSCRGAHWGSGSAWGAAAATSADGDTRLGSLRRDQRWAEPSSRLTPSPTAYSSSSFTAGCEVEAPLGPWGVGDARDGAGAAGMWRHRCSPTAPAVPAALPSSRPLHRPLDAVLSKRGLLMVAAPSVHVARRAAPEAAAGPGAGGRSPSSSMRSSSTVALLPLLRRLRSPFPPVHSGRGGTRSAANDRASAPGTTASLVAASPASVLLRGCAASSSSPASSASYPLRNTSAATFAASIRSRAASCSWRPLRRPATCPAPPGAAERGLCACAQPDGLARVPACDEERGGAEWPGQRRGALRRRLVRSGGPSVISAAVSRAAWRALRRRSRSNACSVARSRRSRARRAASRVRRSLLRSWARLGRGSDDNGRERRRGGGDADLPLLGRGPDERAPPVPVLARPLTAVDGLGPLERVRAGTGADAGAGAGARGGPLFSRSSLARSSRARSSRARRSSCAIRLASSSRSLASCAPASTSAARALARSARTRSSSSSFLAARAARRCCCSCTRSNCRRRASARSACFVAARCAAACAHRQRRAASSGPCGLGRPGTLPRGVARFPRFAARPLSSERGRGEGRAGGAVPWAVPLLAFNCPARGPEDCSLSA